MNKFSLSLAAAALTLAGVSAQAGGTVPYITVTPASSLGGTTQAGVGIDLQNSIAPLYGAIAKISAQPANTPSWTSYFIGQSQNGVMILGNGGLYQTNAWGQPVAYLGIPVGDAPVYVNVPVPGPCPSTQQVVYGPTGASYVNGPPSGWGVVSSVNIPGACSTTGAF